MKKFDNKVWAFIVAASFVIPGIYHLRALAIGDILPVYVYLVGVLFTFVVTILITFVNMILLGRYFDKILPWQNIPTKINKRLILESFITSVSAAMIITLVAFALDQIFPLMNQGLNKAQMYFDNILISLIVNLIALSLIEGNSIYLMWKESLLHTEALKRENVENQFAVLKNQVNPHFLFNSLNVLSSLVAQAPEKAQEFIMEFSRVYRYIFDVEDESVIEVSKELDFAVSFISLHQKRHGDRLKYSVNVSADKLTKFLPVLSLEILVENAIKHNEISDLHPLMIRIYDEDNALVVRNNYQPRKDKPESYGIGLRNLKERYGYLSDKVPVFMRKDDEYIASLPFLDIE
jgi:two-component system, LytTR family, sensor kinase